MKTSSRFHGICKVASCLLSHYHMICFSTCFPQTSPCRAKWEDGSGGLTAAPSQRTKLALDMQLSRESLRHAEGSRPRQGGNGVLSKDWNWACQDGSHENLMNYSELTVLYKSREMIHRFPCCGVL